MVRELRWTRAVGTRLYLYCCLWSVLSARVVDFTCLHASTCSYACFIVASLSTCQDDRAQLEKVVQLMGVPKDIAKDMSHRQLQHCWDECKTRDGWKRSMGGIVQNLQAQGRRSVYAQGPPVAGTRYPVFPNKNAHGAQVVIAIVCVLVAVGAPFVTVLPRHVWQAAELELLGESTF